jgi:hypothetical protein
MEQKEQLDHFLRLLPTRVHKHLTPVASEDLDHGLYHLSINGKIRKFTPSVTDRTALKEDRSVPRVSTASSLLGCLIGYAKARWDFSKLPGKDKQYRGGWYLYQLPFAWALKPTPTLLYDQENSDEHWLVTYSEQTREYPATIVAKCFYEEVRLVGRYGKQPRAECRLLVEVLGSPIRFGVNTVLTHGHWEIEGPEPSNYIESFKHDREYRIRKLSKSDWSVAKKATADLLAYEPPYLEW